MRIGVNASTQNRWDYGKYWGENAYKKVKEFGFSCTDFSILNITNTPFYTLPEEEATAKVLREKTLAQESGVEIFQAHAPVLTKATPVTQEELELWLENTKRCIRFCGIINCQFLVVHPMMVNGWSDRGSPIAADTFEKNVTYMRQLAEYAKEYNVTLCYENMPCIGFSLSHPYEILEVVKKVAHKNLQVCLDIGHTTAFASRLSIGEEIRNIGPILKVLHVHDNYGVSDQHNYPGMGSTNWSEVREALEEIGYDGVFSLELNHPTRFSEEIFEDACKLSFKMANEIING